MKMQPTIMQSKKDKYSQYKIQNDSESSKEFDKKGETRKGEKVTKKEDK